MKKKKTKPTVHEHPLFRAARELATAQQRVDWLVGFANQPDVEKLSPDEVDVLYDHLFAFAARGAESSATVEGLPRSALFEIQDEVRRGLRIAIKLNGSSVGGFAGWPVNLDGITRRVMRGRSSYYGPLRAVFLAAVADTIAEDRERRLGMCARSSCSRFFRKQERAKYCSILCANADRQMRYRKREK